MTTHLWTGFEREFSWCGLDITEEKFWATHHKETISCVDCYDTNRVWVMSLMEVR